ncbi:hypothetical protein [Salmonella phage vB_SalS_TU03]|nr:hypothetical protein [Salmonella phage vB_SalS_TU03]
MVQRYDITGKYMVYPKDEGRIVLYEDYAELIRIILNITDNINVYELPDYLYEKLESRGLL